MSNNEHADFEINIDMTEVPTWDGNQAPLVPAGRYVVTVVDVEQKNLKNKPAIAVTFEIAEGEFMAQKVYNNYNLVTKNDVGKKRLKQLMVACGASLDRFVASEINGAQISVEVYHSMGEARVDAQGNQMEPRWFANVRDEQALSEQAETAAEPPPPAEPPPVTRGRAAAKAGTARRT